jgi:hypothetical protein
VTRLLLAILLRLIQARREIRKLKQEVRTMRLDLSRLTASIDRSSKAMEALVAAHGAAVDTSAADAAVAADQQTVNNMADALDVESAKAEAAVAPVAAPAA